MNVYFDQPKFREMTGEEAQAYVQQRRLDATMHGHGQECTILSMGRALGPQVIIPCKWPREQQKIREDYLWRVTAATMYEREVSARIAAQEPCDVCGKPLVFPSDDDPRFAGDTMVTSECRHVIRPTVSGPESEKEGEL